MAIVLYSILSTPQPQWLAAGNAVRHVAAVPAGSQPVSFYSDANKTNLLASCAAGASVNFTNFGGFFYQSDQDSGASITSSSLKMYALIAAGTIVTNTTAETISAQFQIPANVLFAGAILRIRFQGLVTGVNSTNTIQAILRFGGAGTTADTALITTAATNPAASTSFQGEMVLTVRAAPGGTVAVVGSGTYQSPGAAGVAVDGAFLAPTNFATSSPLFVTVTLTQSAASTGNTALVEQLNIELL